MSIKDHGAKTPEMASKNNPMHSSPKARADRRKSARILRNATAKSANSDKKPNINPMHSSVPHWSRGFHAFAAAARCGARRRAGGECLSPAMENGRCRMHGGASPGAPLGNRNALKHGQTTADGLLSRKLLREVLRSASNVAAASENTARELRRRRLALEALLRARAPAIHSGDAIDTHAREPDA